MSADFLQTFQPGFCGFWGHFVGLSRPRQNKKTRLNPWVTQDIRRVLLWSEQRDLNPRPPSPEPGALPTALCPENTAACKTAVWLGMRESNSHKQSQSLPHYHYANPHYLVRQAAVCCVPQLTRDIILPCPAVVNSFFEIFCFFCGRGFFRLRRLTGGRFRNTLIVIIGIGRGPAEQTLN